MDGHDHKRLNHEALEKEIEAALGVEPSPEFLSRIRARIASDRINEGWLWSSVWRWAGASAVAAIAVAMIGLWAAREPEPAPRDAHIVGPQSPRPVDGDSGLAAPAAASNSSPAPAPAPQPVVHQARAARDPVVMLPEVLISHDEAAALRQLFAAINTRRLETSTLPDLAAALKPPDPIDDIVVEPIFISPIAPMEGE